MLTIPNALSVGRLLCVPVFLWLLFARDNRYAAAGLLAVLAATDFVDGYVARHFDQVSNLGKALDPTADRILLGVGIVAIMVDGSAPIWVGVLALAREGLVAIAAVVLLVLGARRIDVQLVGKAGTFLLLVAFPLFLTSHSTAGWRDLARVLAWGAAVPGLILSWYSLLTYFPMAREALAERRLGSGSPESRPPSSTPPVEDRSP